MKVLGRIVLTISIMVILSTCVMVMCHLETAIVTSGSMEPTIHTGSLVVIDKDNIDASDGDIIAFRKGGAYVTHRVVDTVDDGYVTKGDANENNDPGMVLKENVEGKTILSIPYLGKIVSAIKFIDIRDIGAFNFDKTYSVNRFCVGENSISIEENFAPPEKLYPGVRFSKKVCIKNSGLNSCYVRVLANFNDGSIAKLADLDFNTDAWQYRDDGYYYYKNVLKRGEKTEYLFSSVNIKADAPSDMLKDFQIIIYVESKNSESGGF